LCDGDATGPVIIDGVSLLDRGAFMEWLAPQVQRIMVMRCRRQRSQAMNEIAVLGIDLGKDSCSVTGLDAGGHVILRRRTRRSGVIKLAAGMPPCVMAMEACCGAHHLGRLLRSQGHDVRLMSPEYVRPYVKSQKNDDRDSEAIAEAATRGTMRFVDLKSEEQLDMQILHRARDRLVGERTALINQLRAVLLERGIIIAKGRRNLELHLEKLLTDEVSFSPRIALLIEDMRDQWQALDARITDLDREFAFQARTDETARLLTTIPGIGPLNATAFVAAIGAAETFGRGRDLAAWLGLVPRQMTTGGKPRLLGISKRGNGYLRKMLIHGARAALPVLSKGDTPLGNWLRGLIARAHMNTAVVALAAKMARIVWAVLRSRQPFDISKALAVA
jgi:transposase